MSLFIGQNVVDYSKRAAESGTSTIQNLPAEDFEKCAAAAIEAAVNMLVVPLPIIQFDKRSGRRFTQSEEHREGSQRFTRQVSYIDVTIPFTGSSTPLVLSPTARTMITKCRLSDSRDAIVVQLLDNEMLEKDLEAVMAQIHENLRNFQHDMTSLEADLRSTLQKVADNRFEALKSQQALDSQRSFPIN